MTTGKLIRAERRKAGMTQAELGERAGITAAQCFDDGMDGKSELAFHGLTARWRDAVGLYGSPTCSNCGSDAALKTRFCPHCGARMENAVREQVET